jgi:hypothetical protein
MMYSSKTEERKKIQKIVERGVWNAGIHNTRITKHVND